MGASGSHDKDPHPGGEEPFAHVTQSYSPAQLECQDLTQPLSHYFISSGHNSYLHGNQINSSSGTATIQLSLLLGCRVIELDVFNRQAGFAGPICKHKKSMTEPILLRPCIEALKEHAFCNSTYPVIITIENHADEAHQREMAEMLESILGPALFVPDSSTVHAEWLSPEALRCRFLVRAQVKEDTPEEMRRLIYILNKKCVHALDMMSYDEPSSLSLSESKVPKVLEFAGHVRGSKRLSTSSNRDGSAPLLIPGCSTDSFVLASLSSKAGSLSKASPSHECAVGKGAREEEDLEEDEEEEESYRMPPVTKVDSNGKESHLVPLQDMLRCTSRHLLRVYPASWRIGSSNLAPMLCWCQGASVVALNWQHWDKALWLNSAKFSMNNGCGYVLKPEWMLHPGPGLPVAAPRRLVVHVLCGFRLQKEWRRKPVFIKVAVEGMPVDCAKMVTASSALHSGEILVDERFEFSVSHPELAVLVLQIKCGKSSGRWSAGDRADRGGGTTSAYAALPVATLREGVFKIMMRKGNTGEFRHNRWIKASLSWDD